MQHYLCNCIVLSDVMAKFLGSPLIHVLSDLAVTPIKAGHGKMKKYWQFQEDSLRSCFLNIDFDISSFTKCSVKNYL